MKQMAVFASGSGTNARNIAEYFSDSDLGRVAVVYCNNPSAGVIEKASKLNIPIVIFNRTDFYHTDNILNDLEERKIDLIVLAGFLWLIPLNIIRTFENRIINIHPALLPSYGGKGMYGSKVHEAVINDKKKISGITIHLINEEYDKGKILFQETCSVSEEDSPEGLAAKIHALEYRHFPKVIESYVEKL